MPSRLELIERYRNADWHWESCDVPYSVFIHRFKEPYTKGHFADSRNHEGFLCHGADRSEKWMNCNTCPFDDELTIERFYNNMGWEYREPFR